MNSIPKMSQPEQASAEGLDYIKPKLNEMQAGILAFLKFRAFHGATDSEIAHELGIGDNARKRRGELCKEGHVIALNRKRRSCDSFGLATGPTTQTIWVAKEYAPDHEHTSVDIKRVEERIGALVAAARRLKRILRKDDVSPDELYSRHTAVSEAYQNYATNFLVAWRGMQEPAEPMLRLGDMIVTTRGPAKVTVIHRTTKRYEKYGTDVDEVSWADVRDGFVVVDTDNGHWQYGQSISPVENSDVG
jgi:hypothetical protein